MEIKIKELPMVKIELTTFMRIKSENYKKIKQQWITTENNNLITGIYKIKPFGETVYMICCCAFNGENLHCPDYIKNERDANIMYDKMIKKIINDLKKGVI